MRWILGLLLLAPPAWGDHVVEIRAVSKMTWVAWRGVALEDRAWKFLPMSCVGQSGGKLPCGNLVNGNLEAGWSAEGYHGWVRIRTKGTVDVVVLKPCCGPGDGLKEMVRSRIEIRIDGRLVHRAVHGYWLNRSEELRINVGL